MLQVHGKCKKQCRNSILPILHLCMFTSLYGLYGLKGKRGIHWKGGGIPVRVALVVDEVWRVPVGRPLYDPGLALLALQVQRALVGPEGPERGRGD